MLVSCSTIQNANEKTIPRESLLQVPSWQERQRLLNQIHNWHLKGKIAIQTDQESGSAIVNWTQRKQRFTISLLGPLGNPGITLSGQPGEVILKTSDGKTMRANTPESLLQQVWGWHLPVSYLNYWVKGLPVAHLKANFKFDSSNRLSSINQDKWFIQYQEYLKVGAIDLPNKISISSSYFKTKIIIYDWQIN